MFELYKERKKSRKRSPQKFKAIDGAAPGSNLAKAETIRAHHPALRVTVRMFISISQMLRINLIIRLASSGRTWRQNPGSGAAAGSRPTL